jgi:hypothetical protein
MNTCWTIRIGKRDSTRSHCHNYLLDIHLGSGEHRRGGSRKSPSTRFLAKYDFYCNWQQQCADDAIHRRMSPWQKILTIVKRFSERSLIMQQHVLSWADVNTCCTSNCAENRRLDKPGNCRWPWICVTEPQWAQIATFETTSHANMCFSLGVSFIWSCYHFGIIVSNCVDMTAHL